MLGHVKNSPEDAHTIPWDCVHLLFLLRKFFKVSRLERPAGSLRPFGPGYFRLRGPCPPRYRAAFAFSGIFYPPRHRPSLQSALPPERRRSGLTVFRVFDTMGQVPAIPRRRLMSVCSHVE